MAARWIHETYTSCDGGTCEASQKVMMNSVTRCNIVLRRDFALRCDFLLEVLFKDRDAKVNWCIIWIVDTDTGKKIPKYFVGIPLHENKRLRENYERWKLTGQLQLTERFGRTGTMTERCPPFVDALVQKAIDMDKIVTEQKQWKELKPLLEFRVLGGGDLVADEKESVCRETCLRLEEWRNGYRVTEEEDFLKGYMWESDFTWRPQIASLMEEQSLKKAQEIAKRVELAKVIEKPEHFLELKK